MPSQFRKAINYNGLDPIVLTVPHAAGAATLVLPAGAGARLGTLAADRFFRVTALRLPDTPAEVVLGIFRATGISGNTLTGVTGDEGFANVALPAGTTIQVRPTGQDYEDHSTAISANEAALAGKQRSLALIDVRDYGAVGDGVADDTAAMQAAVDAAVATGKPLSLPPGQWMTTGLVAHGRIDVFGAGVGASVLKNLGVSTAPLLAVAVTPVTIPAAASLSTLSRSADVGYAGVTAAVRCLSLTHARPLKDALDGLADFTIEFVARSAPGSQSTWLHVADAGLDGGATDRLLLSDAGRTAYTLTLRLRQGDGSYVTSTFDTAPAAPSTTAAEHVAFTRSGTTVRTYVAGVLKRTYTGVTGTLEVKPLDEMTLFGASDLPFFRLAAACCARVDSFRMHGTALYSATFTPPATIPWIGGALLWWNADQPQSGGTTPVITAGTSFWTPATIQDPALLVSQDCSLSTFRDFTLREGWIGLYLSGAPGCRVDRVDSYYTSCPIWLQDNCYHASIRDCTFTQPQVGVVAHNASGDLTVANVHAASTLAAGFALVNLQGQALHQRCSVDGDYAVAFVASSSDTVLYEACGASEENRDPARPLTASWVLDDNARVVLRDSQHGGGTAVVPAILAAASAAANGGLLVEGCRFTMHAAAPAVLTFAGTRPATPASIGGSDRSPASVPWVVAGDSVHASFGLTPVARPPAPTTLADVIAILGNWGLCEGFSPASLAPTLWLDALLPLYTDAAGTAPATTDGAAILNAPDRSTAGNTLTRPSGTGAVLRIEAGTRTIAFEGGYLNRDVTSGSLTAFTLHLFYREGDQPIRGNNALFAFGAGGGGAFLATEWDGGQMEAFTIATSNHTAPTYNTDPSWRHLCWIYDGAGATIRTFLDGAEIGPAAAAAPGGEAAAASFARAGLAVGGWTAGGLFGRVRLAELCYYEAAQSAAQVAAFGAYFRGRWSALLNTTDPQVVWVANSLAAPTSNPSEGDAIPYRVAAASSKVARWVAGARGANTTPDLTSRVALDYAKLVASPAPKVAVVWEGTNDIVVNGASAATAYANLVTLAQALRAAGYTKIVMGTVLPRTGLSNTTRGTLNTSIRGNTADWDAVADVGGNATIGADGADTNTTYYHDGVHLTAAGNAIAAPVFRAAIDGLLP
jgi:lysophospholipase L1-like esterase